MDRSARLVLVDAAGDLLGALPPVPVAMPYWQEVSDVVAAVREAYGIDVAVLRLLEADRPAPHGGTVTYLAELEGPPPPGLREIPEDLRPRPHPLRLPYAEPGGPTRSVAWARERLGWPAMTATQQRTWNLSAIWRLDGPDGRRAWLKQVPPFFGHEGAVLRWLDGALPGVAPHLIAAGDEGRLLLGDLPGADGYGAGVAQVAAIAAVQHRIQRRAVAATGELAAAGVPDRRGPRLGGWIRAELAGHEPAVDTVLPDLDARLAALAACGLPDTLVHGDLHAGNTRVGVGPPVIFDWGDSSLGNPAFDLLRLTGHLDEADRRDVVGTWVARWRADAPGADPQRAIALVGPLAPLCGAAAYAMFVARIEPSEHPYHRSDVPDSLDAVASLVAAEPPKLGG